MKDPSIKTNWVDELKKLEIKLDSHNDPKQKNNIIKYYIAQHDLKKYLPLEENHIIRPQGRPIANHLDDKYPDSTQEQLSSSSHKVVEYYYLDFLRGINIFKSQCEISDKWYKEYESKKEVFDFIDNLIEKVTVNDKEIHKISIPFFNGIGGISDRKDDLYNYLDKLKADGFVDYDDLELINENRKIIVRGDANKNILAIFEELESNRLIDNISGNYPGRGPIKKHVERICKYFKLSGDDFKNKTLENMRADKRYKTPSGRFHVDKTNIPRYIKM